MTEESLVSDCLGKLFNQVLVGSQSCSMTPYKSNNYSKHDMSQVTRKKSTIELPRIAPCFSKTELERLHAYFNIYSKKTVTLPKQTDFGAINKYFSTLCLQKWMLFAKDAKLLGLNNLTAKGLRMLFKKHELLDKTINFQEFALILEDTITVSGQPRDTVIELLHIESEETHNQMLLGMGYRPLNKQLVVRKPKSLAKLTPLKQSKKLQTLVNLTQLKDQKNLALPKLFTQTIQEEDEFLARYERLSFHTSKLPNSIIQKCTQRLTNTTRRIR